MLQRIQVAAHLTPEELYARYRHTSDPIERARLHAVWHLAQGRTSQETAEALGYGQKWVWRVLARYNAHGPEALADGRHKNPGHAPLLSADQLAEMERALEEQAPDGGPWSGPKVARWMSERLGRSVAPQRGWEYLRRAGYTPQRPRPKHKDSDPEEQARFPAGTAPGA